MTRLPSLVAVFLTTLGMHAGAQDNLTPIGAEKAGNAAGTIPPWTGGITSAPKGFKAGDRHPDPFANDRVQFEITAANYKDYASQLSPGQMAMFRKYKTYRMRVFPTRRSASFSEAVYEWARQNLKCPPKSAQQVAGYPYPAPRDGEQAMWNHLSKYEGVAVSRSNDQVSPTAAGAYSLIAVSERLYAPRWQKADWGNTFASEPYSYFASAVISPARLAGNVTLIHEFLGKDPNQTAAAWIYNPGQRTVRRAPNIAYDNPSTASDGLRTNDMDNMFSGNMDRHDYVLKGKKELFVNYNAYQAHSAQVGAKDLVKPGHLNPDLMRYELHRVWVVEAKLKKGLRHINPRRTYYLDEDSWQILAIDHYDGQDQVWRYSEAAALNYYDQPLLWTTLETHHDLASGRYITSGLDNASPVNTFYDKESAEHFSAQALRTNVDWFSSRPPGGTTGTNPRRPKGCSGN